MYSGFNNYLFSDVKQDKSPYASIKLGKVNKKVYEHFFELKKKGVFHILCLVHFQEKIN